jgi:hypothetical protein
MGLNAEWTETEGPAGVEGEFAPSQRSPEFGGPAAPPGGHDHADDHIAVVYETDGELFDAVVPFVREGLARDEQCLYVLDERHDDRERVVDALRDGGVDADAALASGALSSVMKWTSSLPEPPPLPRMFVQPASAVVPTAPAPARNRRLVVVCEVMPPRSSTKFLKYKAR